MMPATSSFYVTLTSDPTKEFPDNTLSRFKNRLPMAIRLFAPGWKVGMTSITFPDSQLPSSFLDTTAPTARLCQLGWFVVLVNNVQYWSLEITKDDLQKRFSNTLTPSLFLHAMVDMYQESKIDQAPTGTTFRHTDDEHPRGQTGRTIDTSHTFQWTPEGDLLWDNTKTSPYTYQPRLNFTVFFAKKMGWITHDGQRYYLGKNIEEIPVNDQNAPGDLNQYKRSLRLDGKSITLGGRFWFVEEDKLLWLSDGVSWKFLAHSAPEYHNDQMLFVYSNLVQSSIYNDKVVNLLSEALYKKEGSGVYHFEPTTIRYLPLRTSILETAETHIEDSSGKKLDFRGIKTILNLHFTRDLLP